MGGRKEGEKGAGRGCVAVFQYFLCVRTEQVLEEDSVLLSTIKASKFYNSFATKIQRWEKALNTVSETVELILTVQRKWMYLESIFMASEDICKQLPKESATFSEVCLL